MSDVSELYPVDNDYSDPFKIPPANRIDNPGSLTLYHAATGFEKALADTDAERLMDTYAEAIIDQWNPWQVAYEHLPFLAWAQGVNLWEDWWDETFKRNWTARQWYLKSIRGKRAGLDEFVAAVGGHVKRCIVPPATAFGTKAQTDEERAAYVARFPQLRIYPYVAREQLPWLCYNGVHYDGIGLNRIWNKNGSFMGPRRPVYPTAQDAGGKYTRTAELYEPRTGIETKLTIRRIVNIDMGPGAGWGFTPGVSQYDESVILPLLHRPNYFCSEPRKYLGVNIYLGAELPLRTISIGRSGPMELTQAKAQYQTTFPQAELLQIRPEYISIPHPRRKTELYAARGEYLIRAKSIVTHAVASNCASGSPSFGRTSFVELVVFRLTVAPAINLAAHAPTLGMPLLIRTFPLVATGKTVGAPTLGTPAAGQIVVTVRNFTTPGIAVQRPTIPALSIGGNTGLMSPNNMTSNTAPAPFVASASLEYGSGGYEAFRSFNSTANAFWASSTGSTLPQWIKIDLGSAKAADSYSIQSRTDSVVSQPTAWTLEGSNDNSTWTVADTQSGAPVVAQGALIGTFGMSAPGAYRYWRWTFTAGLSQFYAVDCGNLALYNGVVDAATTAWINTVGAINVTPTRKNLVNALITNLKSDGLWAKLDRLWIYAAENPQSALVDLKALASATINSGAPGFTPNVGYAVFQRGANVISLNYNPTSNGVTFSQNSAHLACWSMVETGASNDVYCGYWGSSLGLYNRDWDGTSRGFINSSGSGAPAAATSTAIGFLLANRSGANAAQLYRNGVNVATDPSASVAPLNASVELDFGTIGAVSIGGSLSSTEQLALYSRLRSYMTAVGVP